MELDAIFSIFQLVLCKMLTLPRRGEILVALIDSLNYLANVWTKKKQVITFLS